MTNFLGSLRAFDDGVQIGYQLFHRVLRIGRIRLAMAAQIRHDDAEIARKMVDLVLPSLRTAAVAMHQHQGALDALGPRLSMTDKLAPSASGIGTSTR